jgi:hypothetical protein
VDGEKEGEDGQRRRAGDQEEKERKRNERRERLRDEEKGSEGKKSRTGRGQRIRGRGEVLAATSAVLF